MTRSDQVCQTTDSLAWLSGFLEGYAQSLKDGMKQAEQYGRFAPEVTKAIDAVAVTLTKSAERIEKIRSSLVPYEVGQTEEGYCPINPSIYGTSTDSIGGAGEERPVSAADAEEGTEASDG